MLIYFKCLRLEAYNVIYCVLSTFLSYLFFIDLSDMIFLFNVLAKISYAFFV